MKWNLFVALRYYFSRRTSTTGLSVFSIAVGVAALIIVISVMNGFQLGFIENILELNSFHIRMRLPAGTDYNEANIKILENKRISVSVPLNDYQTLVQSEFQGMKVIKIIEIGKDIYRKDQGFSNHLKILSGSFNLNNNSSIIIGQQLANTLGVYVGDKIMMLDFEKSYKTGYREYIVTGIFKSGYWDYDSTLAYTGFDDNSPAKKRPVTLGIKLTRRFQDQKVIKWLESLYPGAEVISWREFNKAFFGALRMEKIIMFLLIGLIFILVSVNIFNSLKRSVFEKRDEIGVLLAMGSEKNSVKNIFIYDGTIIGFIGSFFGLLTGLFISVYINEVVGVIEIVINSIISAVEKIISPIFKLTLNHISIFSPAEYYLDKLPTRVIYQEVLIIFLFGVLSAVMAASRASKQVFGIEPARIIREE